MVRVSIFSPQLGVHGLVFWGFHRAYGQARILIEGLTDTLSNCRPMDENCEGALDILEDGLVHGADQIRADLDLSMQKMARVSSALLKTGLIEETGDDSVHHTYRITDLGRRYLRLLRSGLRGQERDD